MPKMKNVLAFLRDPAARLTILSSRGWLNWMGDEAYVKRAYRIRMGKALCLEEPRTFSEKLQWLKLHDRNPLYSRLVDKYEVRQYIAQQLGEDCLIPLVGGPWASFGEIDFAALPEQFVLKCTHDSGGMVICRDKSRLNMDAARKKIDRSMKRNYYRIGREWPYKDVQPRIIAEKYMEDGAAASGLTDYKFFCFNGEPRMLYISRGLEQHATAEMAFFDLQGQRLPFRRSDFRLMEDAPKLPENFAEMTDMARSLAGKVGSPFVRIDLYSIRGRSYFSEVTFYPCGGMIPLTPAEWDETLGQWLRLPEKKG